MAEINKWQTKLEDLKTEMNTKIIEWIREIIGNNIDTNSIVIAKGIFKHIMNSQSNAADRSAGKASADSFVNELCAHLNEILPPTGNDNNASAIMEAWESFEHEITEKLKALKREGGDHVKDFKFDHHFFTNYLLGGIQADDTESSTASGDTATLEGADELTTDSPTLEGNNESTTASPTPEAAVPKVKTEMTPGEALEMLETIVKKSKTFEALIADFKKHLKQSDAATAKNLKRQMSKSGAQMGTKDETKLSDEEERLKIFATDCKEQLFTELQKLYENSGASEKSDAAFNNMKGIICSLVKLSKTCVKVGGVWTV
jgi:hypothetical protein